MAGVNQHYLPQFLQRGFSSHKAGKTSFTWEFRRGHEPRNEAVKEFGADPYFYTTPESTAVDDTITDAEQKFAVLIQRLRNGPTGEVNNPEIARFLAHLEVRTRHLRQSFLLAGTYLVDRLVDYLSSNIEAFIDVVLRRTTDDPAYLRRLLIEEVSKTRLPAAQRSLVVNLAIKQLSTSLPALRTHLRGQVPPFLAAVRTMTPAMLSGGVKDGHIKALSQTIAPKFREEAHAAFRFKVVEVPRGNMVLGDSALLFYKASGEFSPASEKDQENNAVFLPLSPTRMLVGQRDGFEGDFDAIKRAVARCSIEFFIGHENTSENRELKEQIGTCAALLSKSEIEEIAVAGLLNISNPSGISTR